MRGSADHGLPAVSHTSVVMLSWKLSAEGFRDALQTHWAQRSNARESPSMRRDGSVKSGMPCLLQFSTKDRARDPSAPPFTSSQRKKILCAGENEDLGLAGVIAPYRGIPSRSSRDSGHGQDTTIPSPKREPFPPLSLG